MEEKLLSNEHDIIGVFSSLEKAMKKMEEEFKTGDDIYFIDIDFFIVDEDWKLIFIGREVFILPCLFFIWGR